MTGWGPFGWISEGSHRNVFLALTALLLLLSAALDRTGRALVTADAPAGIVSFEFAGSAEGARRIVDSWSAEAREAAMLTQGLDALYLLVYPLWFSLACVLLARRLGGRFGRAGRLIAWLVLAAALLDAVENLALVHILVSGPSDGAARLAWTCAAPKFALVGLAAAYLVAGVAALASRRLRSGRRAGM